MSERGYAEGSRQSGEITVREAARRLGAHPRTVREWARAAIDGERSRLRLARRDRFGRYWVRGEEIETLARQLDGAATFF